MTSEMKDPRYVQEGEDMTPLNDLRLSRKAVYRQGAEDMRERAAKLVEKQWPGTPMKDLSERIRALPINPTEETDNA